VQFAEANNSMKYVSEENDLYTVIIIMITIMINRCSRDAQITIGLESVTKAHAMTNSRKNSTV